MTPVPEGHPAARIAAITGTPGTGKTTVAQHLDHLAPVFSANELARELGAIVDHDEDRASDIVDEHVLEHATRDHLREQGLETAIIEGGLSHFCDPDLVIVLRCHPDVLRERLAARAWSPAKREENVMAETLDAITAEVTAPHAYEVDTTDLDPEEVASIIASLFKGEPVRTDQAHPLGGVDWTDVLMGDDPA